MGELGEEHAHICRIRRVVRIIWNQRDWLDAIAALPVESPLAARVVLVPNARVAHGLKKAAVRENRSALFAGTRFVRPAAFAEELLRGQGVELATGEEALRVLRIRALLARGLPLTHFPMALMQEAPGWDRAFGRAISDLEDAGLAACDLADGEQPWADIRRVWEALDANAGQSWTGARIMTEAARVLADEPEVAPDTVLACVTGRETVAEARFITSLPNASLALRGTRPLRRAFLRRVATLYGDEASAALAAAEAPASASDLGVLGRYLYAGPDELGDPDRPRSATADGSVRLVEYAGVEEEVDAAADWVAQQVLDGAPLNEIALLVPHAEPWLQLVAERLARVPGWEQEPPAYVSGGHRLGSHPAGARVLSVLDALLEHLPIQRFAEVLPNLRSATDDVPSLGAAQELAYRLGTVGGSTSEPERATEWTARAEARQAQLNEVLAAAEKALERGDEVVARRVGDLQRITKHLRALRPALVALCGVAGDAVTGQPLPTIAAGIGVLVRDWIRLGGDGARVAALIDGELARLSADPALAELSGNEALRVVVETVEALRFSTGMYGNASVFVGTVAAAVGLRFRCVRILGLAEGTYPSIPREDPVLSTPLREQLVVRGISIRTPRDRVAGDVHSLVGVLADVDESVVLSTCRLGPNRGAQEPSAVLLEATAALGRGSDGWNAIGTAALRHDYCAPARHAERDVRFARPVLASAWADRAARGLDVPPTWFAGGASSLDHVSALESDTAWGPYHGELSAALTGVEMPGVASTRAISSYRLRKLLICPYRFALEDLLGYAEPAARPELRSISKMSYGSLLHLVAEQFFERYGGSFCQKDADLDTWLELAVTVADQCFDEFCEEYPLVAGAVREQQRDRLRRDTREYIRYDWKQPAERAFAGVEVPFGYPEAEALELPGGPLYVRGYMDRVDMAAGTTIVRDLKSGKPHPRIGKEAGPVLEVDVQLGLYGLIAQQMAAAKGWARKVAAAYVYPTGGAQERMFSDDFVELESDAIGWFRAARALLDEGVFPRTPNRADCNWCPFSTTCSENDVERSAEWLADADGARAAYRALKEDS